ncbi:MAG: efflux RND transporter permease subunit, partial [Candidatus Eremiobacterota bacterium]
GDKLQTVSGVGNIQVDGGQVRAILVEVEGEKLRENQVAVSQVVQAVKSHNAQVPGGKLRSRNNEYEVNLDSQLSTAAEFSRIIVVQPEQVTGAGPLAPSEGAYSLPVHVGDLGRVRDAEKDATSLSRLNGKDTLTLSVTKTSEANLLEVVKGVRQKLEEIKPLLPSDVTVEVVRDNSTDILRGVDDLRQDLILGAALACLTVFVFLGNLRLTVVAGIAIPISLIATFAFLYVSGYTLNSMTLLALSLAVGIVVDDAVVVLENVYKTLQEQDLTPLEAAQKGLEEIAFAVLATTMSLVVLFLPLAFMPGLVGMYFRSWGLTMAVAILLSMVVSFTLTPMLCAYLLKAPKGARGEGPMTRLMQNVYGGILAVALKLRWLVLAVALVSFVWGLHLLKNVGKDFLAKEDDSQYTVNLTMPRGWPLERVVEELKPVEADMMKLPHVTEVLLTGDNDTVSFFVQLTPYAARKPYTQFQSIDAARAVLARYAVLQPSVDTSDDKDFEYTVIGDDLQELQKLSDEMLARLGKIPGFVDLDSSMGDQEPEVRVRVDQERAADLGVDVEQASQAVQIYVAGLKVTTFQRGSRSYDVTVRAMPNEREHPEDAKHLYVPSQKASVGLVTLDTVADITVGLGPSDIDRLARQRKVTVSANLTRELPLGSAQDRAAQVFQALDPPPGYGPQPTGNSKFLAQTALAAFQSFVLSVLFMYMVMASQFENLLDPFIILLTLPLAIPFAVFSLVAAGMTLNLFSVLGLFLLFGVVKKNAILQVDRTNQLLRQGMPTREAILQANRDRLRPILMTTLTLVVAMIPVAFAGPTGATKAPMAMVVVGGQSLCLLLTLLVVPVGTSIVEDIQSLFRRKRA